jgi:hypothetical protein
VSGPASAKSPVQKTLGVLEGVEHRANGTWALCPAHDDHDPSLNIKEGDDGRALLHCFAGCDQGEVLGALEKRGLKSGELFESRNDNLVPLNGHSWGPKRARKSLGELVTSGPLKMRPGPW